MPSTEVHIVTYQSADDIEACIQSVLDHSSTDVSIVVLDNASTDGTADLIERAFPDVTLIRSAENLLYGPACNLLAAQATSERILLLNPDAVFITDVVRGLNDGLDATGALVALPVVTDEDGRPQPIIQRFPALRSDIAATYRHTKLDHVAKALGWSFETTLERSRNPAVPAHQAFDAEFLCSACWMMPTQVAARFPFSAQFPLYDTDVELSRRLADAGVKATLVDSARVVHTGGASSSGSSKRRLEQEARFRYYRLFHGRGTATAYRAATGVYGTLRRLKTS